MINTINHLVSTKTPFCIGAAQHSTALALEKRNHVKKNVKMINTMEWSLQQPWQYNVTKHEITCAAGLTLGQIGILLQKYNRVLHGTPEASTITLGGALNNSAHGGGIFSNILASHVTSYWFQDANFGLYYMVKPLSVDNSLDYKKFSQTLIGHGLLGVLLFVTIQTFEALPFERLHYVFDKALENQQQLDSLLKYFVKENQEPHSITFAPYSQKWIMTTTKWIVPKNVQDNIVNKKGQWWKLFELASSVNIVTSFLDWVLTLIPSLGKKTSESLFSVPFVVTHGKFDTFTTLPGPENDLVYDMSFSVALQDMVECVKALKDIIQEYALKNTFVAYRFWCRFVHSDTLEGSIVQSNNNDTKVVFDLVLSRKALHAREFLKKVSDLVLSQFHARMHLGKTFLVPETYNQAFFKTLKQEYDPHNLIKPLQS